MKPTDVPPGPLLIDTDVFSYVLLKRGPYLAFRELIDGHDRLLSFATVGELWAAPETTGSLWAEAKRAELDLKIREHVILTATDAVTRKYGLLHARFQGQLEDGNYNDLWVAACSLGQPIPPPLVTNNLKDYTKIASAFPELVLIHPDLAPSTPPAEVPDP